MSKILSHTVHKKIYILNASNKNRLISIEMAVNRPCYWRKTPVLVSVRKFNGFNITFGLSCRELRGAKEAFFPFLNCLKANIQ